MFELTNEQRALAQSVRHSIVTFLGGQSYWNDDSIDSSQNTEQNYMINDETDLSFGITKNYKGLTIIPSNFHKPVLPINSAEITGAYDDCMLFKSYGILQDPVKVHMPMSLKKCIELTIGIDNFYGILVEDTFTGAIFNPLHPMIALNLIQYESLFNVDEARYEPIIFAYKQGLTKEDYEEANLEPLDTPRPDYDSINLYLMECMSKQLNITFTSMKNHNNLRDMIHRIKSLPLTSFLDISMHASSYKTDTIHNFYTGSNYTCSPNDVLSALIPNQILARGTPVPYYGITYVHHIKGKNVLGTNLTPMLSSNVSVVSKLDMVDDLGDDYKWKGIDSRGASIEEDFRINTEGNFTLKDNEEEKYISKYVYDADKYLTRAKVIDNKVNSSICTGKESKHTHKGLLTLNHSNTLSAYNVHILVNGWVTWAKYARELSYTIYKEAQWIK